MIERSIFMPQHWAAERAVGKSAWMISITDPGQPAITFAAPYGRVLRLSFRDLVKPDPKAVTFDDAMGLQVVEFAAAAHAHPDPVDMLVHCRKGQSRSAAVASWIAKRYWAELRGEPANIGDRMANGLVLAVLDRVCGA